MTITTHDGGMYPDPDPEPALYTLRACCEWPTRIEYLGPRTLCPDGRSQTTLKVSGAKYICNAIEYDREVKWTVKRNGADCRITKWSETAGGITSYYLKIVAGTKSGRCPVIVRASDAKFGSCFLETDVVIGCSGGCASGSCGTKFGDGGGNVAMCPLPARSPHCSDPARGEERVLTPPVEENAQNNIAITFSLGSDSAQRSTGELTLAATSFSEDLLDPLQLRLSGTTPDFRQLTSSGEYQYKAPDGVVRIKEFPGVGYELRFFPPHFYPATDWNNPHATWYAPYDDPNPVPTVTWQVERVGTADILRVTEFRGGMGSLEPGASSGTVARVYDYEYLASESGGTWLTYLKPDPDDPAISMETSEWEPDATQGQWVRIITQVVDGATLTTKEIWRDYEFIGRQLIERTIDPGGLDLTTNYDYYPDTDPDPNDAYDDDFLRSEQRPDGSWTWYIYELTPQRKVIEISGWKDQAFIENPSYNDPGVRSTVSTYDADGRLLKSEEWIAGNVVSRTDYAYNGDVVTEQQRLAPGDNAPCLTTVTTYVASEPWRVDTIVYTDGRQDTYGRDWGTYDPQTGVFTPGDGRDLCETVTHGTTTNPSGIANKTTRSRTITYWEGMGGYPPRPESQKRVSSETAVCTSPGTFATCESTLSVYDEQGRITDTYRSNGAHEHTEWADCCSTRTVTSDDGVVTTYEYDLLGRPELVVRDGVAGQTGGPQYEVQTRYVYGFANARKTVETYLECVTNPPQGAKTLRTRREYDLAGRLVSEKQGPSGAELETTYQHDLTPEGGRRITAVRPDTSTEITEYYRDGQVRSVTGSGIVAKYHDYTSDDGEYTTTVHTGSDTSPRVTTTTYDMLGRMARETRPAYLSGTITTVQAYYPDGVYGAGQLASSVITDNPQAGTRIIAPTLYTYSALGELLQSGLDLDENGLLEPTGTDRITETESTYWLGGADWWRITTTRVYAETGAVTAHTSEEQLSALPSSGWRSFSQERNELGEVEHWVGEKILDYGTYKKKQIHEFNRPQTTVTTYVNGLLTSTFDNESGTQYEYDCIGRQVRSGRDADGNPGTPETTVAVATTYNDLGQVDYTIDAPGKCTDYEYYPNGQVGGGRVRVIKRPDDPNDSAAVVTTRYSYNSSRPGQPLWRVWGDDTQPVEYEYDPTYGERTGMTTFRDENNWSGETWPGGTGDTTSWAFDPASGLLTQKTDAQWHPITYTYTPDGRMKQRTWARQVTTTYNYWGEQQDEPKTGELRQIDYSDGTPDVTFTYNRLGKLTEVVDGIGTHLYTYDPTNPDNPLNLKYERITSSIYGTNVRLTPQYDLTTDSTHLRGRWSGMIVTRGATTEYTTTATYDEAGRIERVKGPGLDPTVYGGARYIYKPHTDQVAQIELGGDGVVHVRTTRNYEANRDLITFVGNDWERATPLTTLSSHAYVNGELGHRRSVTLNGIAYGPSNRVQLFDYNSRNELTGSSRDSTDWTYGYDPIGNRTSAATDDVPTTYVANDLNQYDRQDRATNEIARERYTYDSDGNLLQSFVAGDMNCDGQVTFADINLFIQAINCNDSELCWVGLGHTCPYLNADINGDGHVTFADINPYNNMQTQGNAGAARTYTWDAENRLIQVKPTDGTTVPDQAKRVTFVYDYLGRRAWKQVETYTGGTWSVSAVRKYVWDGWRMLLEMDGSGTILKKYTWGLDLAGLNGQVNSLDGAGTISGLLAVQVVGGAPGGGDLDYAYLYDANGNVGQLVDWSYDPDHPEDALVAKYEYDPYGGVTAATGSYAADNVWRFSTKQFDAETGLGYWGYRYFSPTLGRWISRDPMEEAGGTHLYTFGQNDPLNHVDALGHQADPFFGQRFSLPEDSEPKGCCGPEIASALAATVAAFQTAFSGVPPTRQAQVCSGMKNSGGWDIWELQKHGSKGGSPSLNAPGCGTNTCAGSVKVNGRCFRAGEVNYYLWGNAFAMCSRAVGGPFNSLTWAKSLTYGWRALPEAVRGWAQEEREPPNLVGAGSAKCRAQWTTAGFYGNLDLVSKDCELPSCSKNCCKKELTQSFSGHVGPGDNPLFIP